MTDDLKAVVFAELRRIPRGSPPQDLYRIVYALARMNGVGNKGEVSAPAPEAREFAVHIVQQRYPEFVPAEAVTSS